MLKKIKLMLLKNKKNIIITSLILLIVGVISLFLFYDYSETNKEYIEQKNQEREYNLITPNDFKQYIPDTGQLIYLEFIKSKNSNNLTKLNDFAKALYYAIDRKKIVEINNEILQPTSVLFTKEFFQDQKYFNSPFFSQSSESNKLYQEIDLVKQGYDFDKALKFLTASWDQLTVDQKNENYQIKIYDDMDMEYMKVSCDIKDIDNDVNHVLVSLKKDIKTKIIENINHLFSIFIKNKGLKSEQLTLIEVDKKYESNLALQNFLSKNDPYHDFTDCLQNIRYYFFKHEEILNNNQKITFDFLELKNFLEAKKNSGAEIDEGFFQGRTPQENIIMKDIPEDEQFLWQEMSYPGINQSDGTLNCTMAQFWDFFDQYIQKLISYDFRNISVELQKVKQKTYEEIFEKILCSVFKTYVYIPIAVLIEDYNQRN